MYGVTKSHLRCDLCYTLDRVGCCGPRGSKQVGQLQCIVSHRSRSTEDIQCIVLHRSTGPGGFSPGSLYVVGIYRPGIHCIVLDHSTSPAGGHRLRFRDSGSSMGPRLGGCVCFTVNTNSGGLNGFYISVDSGKVCPKGPTMCLLGAVPDARMPTRAWSYLTQ